MYGSAASLPGQEWQEMEKGSWLLLEGRCCVVPLSAVLVLRKSSSVCPWLRWELFQECHVNLPYFRDVRNPWELKPLAGAAWLLSLCTVREVLPPLSPLLLQDTKTGSTSVPGARFLGKAGLRANAGCEERHPSVDSP